MAKPVIYSLDAMSYEEDNNIPFTYSGGTIKNSQIRVSETTNNTVVYESTQNSASTQFLIPANSIDVTTYGTQYYIQIRVTDLDNTKSSWSDTRFAYFITTPTFQFSNVLDDQVIKDSYLEAQVMYYQLENELLQNIIFYLYDSAKNLLLTSGIIYDVSNLKYTYNGLVDGIYYIRAKGETVHGYKVDTGDVNITVDYVTPETQYVLVNALGIDMEWKNVIQPIYKGWSVDYKHHNYYAYVSDLTSSYYSELDFEGKSSKAVTIGASIDNYDIINDLGEESIRNTVGAKYEEFLASGECADFGIEFPDKETYLNQYIEEIGASYGTADSSTDFMIYSDSDYKVFAKDLKEYNGVTLQYIGIMPQTKDLDEFIKSASVDEINSLIKSLKSIKNDNFKSGVITRITGKIPLFSYDYQLELQKDLESLGITDVFDVDKADLSNIASTKSYIASATHKANIEFSNEGIKAAAATTMGGYGASSCEFEYLYDVPVEEIDMTFDHPFMYIIRDKATGEVWFVGTVYEPTEYSFDALGY